MDLYAELVELARALTSAGIPYALCGGLAVAAHGAPRATKDIDLLVRPEALAAIESVVEQLGFRHRAGPMRFRDGMELRRISKIANGQHLTLDLLLVNPDLEDAWGSRFDLPLGGATLSVIGRDALIRMKLSAARPIDLHDVERLESDDR